MRLQKITSPTALPINMDSVKDHLRIERADKTQDDDLTDLIWTATAYVQERCHLQLINTQYKAYWDRFPWGSTTCLKVPLWPVVTIDSLAYVDSDGASQTITDYQSDLISAPAIIRPAISGQWPATQSEKVNAVTLTFTAGYGASYTTVPYMVKHALKIMVAHWYRHREAVLTGTISKEIELAMDSLVVRSRVNEFEAFERQDQPSEAYA